jgi:hypothetical protein
MKIFHSIYEIIKLLLTYLLIHFAHINENGKFFL